MQSDTGARSESGAYHAGERAVHTHLGVEWQASRVGAIIRPEITAAVQAFLRAQPFAVVGSVDSAGHVWASLLNGRPGFLEALDERTLRIDAAPTPGDPLEENLREGADLGLIVIDLATRRRVRVNGRVIARSGTTTLLRTGQVYGNCPKYIQARRMDPPALEMIAPPSATGADRLSASQQHWIAQADTFFIASHHPEGGADASHRGGMPGFARVVYERRLRFPDYPGNLMFNTLGNLVANPGVGLLFLDFECGRTLQLTGTATIRWSPDKAADFRGAERLLDMEVGAVVEIAGATPFRWTLLEYSPFNLG